MKKLVALLMALAMLLSFAGFAESDEPFVITVMLPDHNVDVDFQHEDNPVLKAIEEASGVRLQIIFAANSTYGDTLNTTMTDPSEKQPMIVRMTDARGTTMINNARAGAFWDLTEYVNDPVNYPNLVGNAGVYSNISIDGRVYGIYCSRAYPRAGIYYRKDIAAECGITEIPETIEELTELTMALAEYKDDCYAINMCSYTAGTISIATVMHGAPNEWGIDENGEIYPAHKDPAYLEGLKWLRAVYEAGGIDPNFATIDSSTWNNPERNGTAFMRFDCLDNCYRQQEWFETNAGITEQIWEYVGPVAQEDGEITVWPQNPGFAGELVVTKAVKEEDLPKVMKFLDWCNTAEGQMLLNCGVEGVTYWITEAGYRTATHPEGLTVESGKINGSINQLGMGVMGDLTVPLETTSMRARYNELNEILAPFAVANPCYPFVSETNVAFGTQLATILSDAATQFIAGIIDEDGLMAAWDQWEAEGGAKITEEYNDAYQASLS